MTEEDFLQRWSRRKREVAKPQTAPPPKFETPPADQVAAVSGTDEPEFDVASLPPLESINALTDVTAFLRAGVPVDLTRAALRRVWTADPSIRDFVGLAENAWDFTDPDAMPGFGPLESSDEIRRMIADLVDQIGKVARPDPLETADPAENASDTSGIESASSSFEATEAGHVFTEAKDDCSPDAVLLQSDTSNTASQHDVTEGAPESLQLTRRSHGGALPR